MRRMVWCVLLVCASAFAETSPRVLLGSGGFWDDAKAVKFWRDQAESILGPIDSVLVIPYAKQDHRAVLTLTTNLRLFGSRRLENIDSAADPVRAVHDARAIFIPGGNTFRLLKGLQDQRLIEAIRERVQAGVPYLGVSAGINVACPTIKTTNDMPIVEPRSLNALALLPFQINPHYFPGTIHWHDASGGDHEYAGETREIRINEFHEENERDVLGIPEKSILRWENGQLGFLSLDTQRARLFRRGQAPREFSSPSDLTRVLLPSK